MVFSDRLMTLPAVKSSALRGRTRGAWKGLVAVRDDDET